MRPISSRQVTGVLLVVLSGWSLTMTAQDGRDGWIVLLLAGLCSLPVAALCCLASERMPQGDWFQLPRAACGLGQYWRDCLAFYAQAAIKHLEWRKSCIRFCSCRSLSSRQAGCLQKCILRAAHSRS